MLVEFAFNFFPKIKLDKPIYDGFIYFGEPDSDPYFNTSKRIDVTYIGDDGLEKDLVQPLRTSKGGVPTVDGEYVKIFISQDYAMTAAGKNNEQILYVPSSKDFESNERITEDVFLSDGQVKVFFNRVQTTDLSYYISGNFVDRGRLDEGIDYTIVGDNNILLTNSFPAGSVLSGMQNAIEGESDTASTNINRTKAISDGYILTNLDSQSILIFNTSIDATINVPDGLTDGCGVIVSNIGQGGVTVAMGTDVLRGNNELVDRSGQISIIKFNDTTWQSSERGTEGPGDQPLGPPVVDPGLPAISPPAAIPDAIAYDWSNATDTQYKEVNSLDQYGSSIAISGDGLTAVVLAGADRGDITGNGAFYFYDLILGVWTFKQAIIASSGELTALYANTLKLNNDGTVFVCGNRGYISGTGQSKFYFKAKGIVYTLVNDVWQFTQGLEHPDYNESIFTTDEFAKTIVVSGDGDWICVGAPMKSDSSPELGALYFYKRNNGVWDYTQKYQALNLVELGSSLSMSGDGLTLFAAQGIEDQTDTGTILVFSNDSDTWNFRAEITVIGGIEHGVDTLIPISTNYLGSMVAFGGEITYVYYGSGSSWAEDDQLTIASSVEENVSINYDGNMITRGVQMSGTGGVQGRVDIYTRDSGTWSLDKTYEEVSQYKSEFGYSLFAHPDGSGAIIGAYQINPNTGVLGNPGRGAVTFIEALTL